MSKNHAIGLEKQRFHALDLKTCSASHGLMHVVSYFKFDIIRNKLGVCVFPNRYMVRSSVRMNQALCVCLTTVKQSKPFQVLFASLLSGWATTTGRLLGLNGNKCKVSFPRTQRRIASSGIEPGVSSFSIANPDAQPTQLCW